MVLYKPTERVIIQNLIIEWYMKNKNNMINNIISNDYETAVVVFKYGIAVEVTGPL